MKLKDKKSTKISQSEILDNRHKLRQYCRQEGIATPDFFASNQFLPISHWAMKKNSFPLVLKTSENLSSNRLIFVLRAFRELPEFFEAVQRRINEAEVLIEEFLEPKANIEVTLINKEIKLITQIGFNKSMRLQQKWRAFPIKLPSGILNKIQEIIKHFDEIISLADVPFNFSFAIKGNDPILLSINKNPNRLEYLDKWREPGELTPLKETIYPDKSRLINRINIYRDLKEEKHDFTETTSICKHSKVKIEVIEKKLYLMLTASGIKELEEDFEKVNAMIKQIIHS